MTRMLVVASETLSPLSIGGPIPIDGQPRWWRCECGHRTRFGAGYSNPRHHHSGDDALGSMVADGPFPFTVAVWQEATADVTGVEYTGRLSMHDVDLLARHGISVLRQLADRLGVTPEEARGMVSRGEVTEAMFRRAVPSVGAVVATVEVTGEGHDASDPSCEQEQPGTDGLVFRQRCGGSPFFGWHTPTGTVTRLDVPIPMERPTGVCVMCDAEDGPPSHVHGQRKCCPDCEHPPASFWWADIDREATVREDLAGPCDTCGGEIGERGWMKSTGREHDGLPIVKFYCSSACAQRHVR